MPINQITTANTFGQWITATQALIAVANAITDGGSSPLNVNSHIEFVGSEARLNVRTLAIINSQTGNTATIGNVKLESNTITFSDNTTLGSNVIIVSAFSQANAAFNKANSANVLAQAAFNKANSTVTVDSAFAQANAAFNKANSANVVAQAGFDKANSANVLAQQAYNAANTAKTTADSANTSLNASNLIVGTIPTSVLGRSVIFIGTTSVALNRATGGLALSGISANGYSFTPRTSATLTIGEGKTFNSNVSVTLEGNNQVATTMTFPLESANIGFREIPQVNTSTAYTTVLSDNGKHIFHPSNDSSARTWTIASNANVPYPVGASITFINEGGAGSISIAIQSTDVLQLAGTGSTGTRTLTANGVATAVKIKPTKWIISGTNLS